MPRPFKRRARELINFINMKPWENPAAVLPYFRYSRHFQRLQRAFTSYRYVVAILWAHELGLFDCLDKKPATLEELKKSLKVRTRPLEQLLIILEAEGWVQRSGPCFSLTPPARHFLTSSGSQSVAGFLDLFAAHHASYSQILKGGMRKGTVPPRMNIFSPRSSLRGYLLAVNSYLHWIVPELLEEISLPRISRFIVGSMGVSFSAHLMRQSSQARVTYGCLPHLVKQIPMLVERYGIPRERIEGMHAHMGDPMKDRWGVNEQYDLVFLTKKLILKPEEKIGEKFVAKASRVLNPGGVLILWETVHPDHRPTSFSQAMEAVLDLGASPDGPVLTERRVRQMLHRYMFSRIFIKTVGPMGSTFVVAYK